MFNVYPVMLWLYLNIPPNQKNILCEIPTTANHISFGRFCWIHTIVWGWHIFMCEKKKSSISKTSTATINSILSKNENILGITILDIRYIFIRHLPDFWVHVKTNNLNRYISTFTKLEYLRQAWVVYLPNITFFYAIKHAAAKQWHFWGEKLDDVVTHAQAEIWSEHGAMNHKPVTVIQWLGIINSGKQRFTMGLLQNIKYLNLKKTYITRDAETMNLYHIASLKQRRWSGIDATKYVQNPL